MHHQDAGLCETSEAKGTGLALDFLRTFTSRIILGKLKRKMFYKKCRNYFQI